MTTADIDVTLDDLPIPKDARVTSKWPAQMVEMADHIGAYDTLRVIERFGGQQVWIAADPERNLLRAVLDARKTRLMSEIYRSNELELPTGKAALAEARRASVIASVRNGDMTVRAAAKLLRTARTYVSRLVNQTDEGRDAKPLPRVQKHDPRQVSIFDILGRDDADNAQGGDAGHP